MGKEAKKGSLVLILTGPYDGQRATVTRIDRKGTIMAKINRGEDAGEETLVTKGNYKVI